MLVYQNIITVNLDVSFSCSTGGRTAEVSVPVLWACIVGGVWAESGDESGTGRVYTLPAGVPLKDGDTYDYIVVGAGAGGCPAAARLALAGHSVLLVEAGGYPPPLSEVPAAAAALQGSGADWQYPTRSNNASCLSSRGRACRFSRGKCLGGSTAINYMIYTRGNRRDYELGLPGWTWRDLEPYFLRYEGLRALDRLPPSSRVFHNTSGTLKVDFFADSDNPWRARLVDGFRRLGFPFNADVNGVSQIGVTRVVGYTYRGGRMSAARAYLGRDDVKRALKVALDTLCTGVILDDSDCARGVTVRPRAAPAELRLFARKEVVLCAGAIGTPQILMLSGIGEAQHLRSVGVPVRVQLPVGERMTDHVLPLVLGLVDRNRSLAAALPALLGDVAEYAARQGGPLASAGLVDVNAFGNTGCYDARARRLAAHSGRRDCELPDLQIISAYVDEGLLPLGKRAFQRATNLDSDAVDQIAAANAERAIIVHSPVLLRPHSQGFVRLASADPTRPPLIYPNYLSDERDVRLMLRSIGILEDLYETEPFKSRGAALLRLRLPGCAARGRGYWRCHVRHLTHAVFHAVGTAALGRVLDARLRVRAVRRLRVADASAWPRLVRGNTEAACLALGERVADFLAEDVPSDQPPYIAWRRPTPAV